MQVDDQPRQYHEQQLSCEPYTHDSVGPTALISEQHIQTGLYFPFRKAPAQDPNDLPIAQSRTPTPRSQIREESPDQNGQAVAQRSRWQAVLLEAGGIGAAVSEESMRRLKYCLQWLQVRTISFLIPLC